MAIVFDYTNIKCGLSTWPEKVFGLSAPNYLKWSSNAIETPVTSTISDGAIEFRELYSNSNNEFTFNLSLFAIKTMQDLKGADKLQPFGSIDVFFLEVGRAIELSNLWVKLFYETLPDEIQNAEPLIFIPAYRQSKNRKKASFFEEAVTEYQPSKQVQSRCLLPTNNVTIFKGYPQDVCIFYYKIINPAFPTTPPLLARFKDDTGIPVGDTDNISDVIDYGILRVKLHDLPWQSSPRKIDICTIAGQPGANGHYVHRWLDVEYLDKCGTYIRWLNSYGGWSYWLFESAPLETVDVETPETINLFTSNPFADETFKVTQKQKQRTITVSASTLKDWQIEHLSDLIDSRNVYVFNDKRKDSLNDITMDDFSWSPIRITAFAKTPNGAAKVRDVSLTYLIKEDYTPAI